MTALLELETRTFDITFKAAAKYFRYSAAEPLKIVDILFLGSIATKLASLGFKETQDHEVTFVFSSDFNYTE